jgi:tetratricopeptide (TPR) repeat protein
VFELSWAHPWLMLTWLLIPALVGLYVIHWMWKFRVNDRLGNPRLLLWRSARKQVAQFVLVLLGLALCLVALARPQWGEKQRTVKREGIDIVFALDISKSMLAADVNPNRLRAAKDELSRVLYQLRGDRAGLVVFTGISFAQAPLTSDYGAIKFYLRRLHPNDMPVGGTASGRAITDAIELLTGERLLRGAKEAEELSPETAFKRAKTQVIVLITDGEDHEGNPEKAAALAAERGIRIYTIGMGSAEGVPIPIHDRNGGTTGYKRDRQGNTVYTKLNAAPLKKVAEMTGGTYAHYDARGSMANAITTALNDLEKDELETLLRSDKEDRFYIFLLPGLFLILLGTLLGQRRGIHPAFWRDKRVRSGRRDERTLETLMVLLAVLPVAVGAQGCDELHDSLVRYKLTEVEDGNRYLAAGDGKQALASYKEAEKKVPPTPELHYDLGTGHVAGDEAEFAVGRLNRSMESTDEALRFDAFFNLGLAYVAQERWKEALVAFKGALALQPGSQDAKLAYELTLAKLYPPCAELEDDSEENDEPASPTALKEPELKERSLCGADDDWYATAIYPGSIVVAKATFTRLRKKEEGDPAMLHDPTALTVALVGPDGETVLGVGKPALDPETGKPKPDEDEKIVRVIGPLRITPEMLGGVGEREQVPALLRVAAESGVELKYDVRIDVVPPCFALEEESEENDTAQTAANLGEGEEHRFQICKGDPDWLSVQINPTETLFIDVDSSLDIETQRVPLLEVGLYAEDGVTKLSEVEQIQTPSGPLYGVQIRDPASAASARLLIKGIDDEQQGPYRVRVYRYLPCESGAGDDRLEENDQPQAAKDLDRTQGPVRHLRYCPGDRDFYKLTAQKEDRIMLGLHHDEVPGRVTFRLMNESADTEVVAGSPTGRPEVQQAFGTEEIEEDTTFILHVDHSRPDLDPAGVDLNPPTHFFYDVIPLDGDKSQPPPEEPQEGDEEGEENPDEEEKEGEEEEQEPQDGGDEGDEAEEQPEPTDSDEEKERIEEILENLEESDDNFQLKRALERMPERYIENDW